MDVTPLIKEGQNIIQSYAGGRFRISGELYANAVIVLPDTTMLWTVGADMEGLQLEDFEPLMAMKSELDVVLLGCGARMAFLDPDLKNSLQNQGVNVDVMDTGAACRTYNVLMAEGRRVAAALLPV